MIHIPKQFVTRASLMRITPSWVSNGHWCLRRELVRNLADLQSLPDVEWREYEDSMIEDFITQPANRTGRKYEFTGLAKVRSDGMSDLLKYEAVGGVGITWDRFLYLDRDYINMAHARGKGIDTSKLYSRNGETFYSKCKQFIVQAVRQ